MARYLSFYLKFCLFWLFVFCIQRMVFLLLNTGQLASCRGSLVMKSVVYGLIMDVSVTSYFLALVIFIFFLTLPFKPVIYFKTVRVVVDILIVLTCLLTVCDSALQHYWNTRINEKALSVLLYPRMAFDAARSTDYLLLIAVMGLMTGLFMVLYRYLVFGKQPISSRTGKGSVALVSLVLIPLLIIGARGGVQKYPLGKATVFFSDNFTCNYAALNPFWNFADILLVAHDGSGNRYQYFPGEVVNREFDKLFQKKETGEVNHIFSVEKPNIVLILLESFSGENLPKLNGIPVAMKLNALLDSSLWFSNFYSNGFRSEHALIALLSGTPPLPGGSLLRESNRIVRLPLLGKQLKDSLGYSLQVYNTYDITYARMNEYLSFSGFEKIVTDKNFMNCRRHEWGAYDETLFDYVLKDLGTNKPPFFSLVLTSVSHEPFKAEVRKVFPGNNEQSRYKNTVCYTDSCLGDFLDSARLKPWYKNTVFIIMADHGHAFPMNRNYADPRKFNIPFLIFGEPLKKELAGKSIPYPASQIDLPATILHQLGMSSLNFPLSRDLMKEDQPHFAFFTFSDGFGYVSEKSTYSFNRDLNRFMFVSKRDEHDSLDLLHGKIILQWLSNEYRNLN